MRRRHFLAGVAAAPMMPAVAAAQRRSFELIVNAAAAKALKIALPPSLLRRADEVIE